MPRSFFSAANGSSGMMLKRATSGVLSRPAPVMMVPQGYASVDGLPAALLDGRLSIIIVKLVERRYDEHHRWNSGSLTVPMVVLGMWCLLPVSAIAATGDEATHEADHALDADIIELPGACARAAAEPGSTGGAGAEIDPLAGHPFIARGKPLDDWMKARLLVSKEAQVTVVVLESAKHRELTIAGIIALNQWTFAPQLKGDDPVDGELTVRIHFRSQ